MTKYLNYGWLNCVGAKEQRKKLLPSNEAGRPANLAIPSELSAI